MIPVNVPFLYVNGYFSFCFVEFFKLNHVQISQEIETSSDLRNMLTFTNFTIVLGVSKNVDLYNFQHYGVSC